MIPVSVIVATLNEESRIGRCLEALAAFDEVFVVDSGSSDRTATLAAQAGAKVVRFCWDGRYPKKRQWCLDHLPSRHEWIFFVDADETVTPALTAEIGRMFAKKPARDGYFIKGRYVIDGKILRFGLNNNKLCLFDRRRFVFPAVDDLDLPGMGEIEGHYQPVARDKPVKIGQLSASLLHHAYDENWEARHRRYAAWEAGMNRKNAWPADPVRWRQAIKRLFRALPGRSLIAFLHCYVGKGGFLDGKNGLRFAVSRLHYYAMIRSSRF